MTKEFDHQRENAGRRTTDCDPGTCGSHSGVTIGIKGLYALLIVLITMFGVQMVFQIPGIRVDILNEVKGITARIVELEKKDIQFTGDIADLKKRVTDLEPHK